MDNTLDDQLLSLFNSLFSTQSLRKNVYIFNSLNQHMQIHLKTISKQRRVIQITNKLQIIQSALKRCKLIQQSNINDHLYKILMKGDFSIVQLSKKDKSKISKKDIVSYTKHMKCQYFQEKEYLKIYFLSHAAAVEFSQRIRIANQEYVCQLQQKDPYKCLEQSINIYRKQKHTKIHQQTNQPHHQHNNQIYQNTTQTYQHTTQPYQVNQLNQASHINPLINQNYYQYDYNQQYSYVPIFIRRAIDSQQQQQQTQYKNNKNQYKKYIEKQIKQNNYNNQQRIRLNSQDFPSFQSLNNNINKLSLNNINKQEKQQKQQQEEILKS